MGKKETQNFGKERRVKERPAWEWSPTLAVLAQGLLRQEDCEMEAVALDLRRHCWQCGKMAEIGRQLRDEAL